MDHVPHWESVARSGEARAETSSLVLEDQIDGARASTTQRDYRRVRRFGLSARIGRHTPAHASNGTKLS
jgi:hypothetical protein